MFKYYRCEYCDRKILTEICRYCGGINDFSQMTPVQPQNTKDPASDKTSETKRSKPTDSRTGIFSSIKGRFISLFSLIGRHKASFFLITSVLALFVMLGFVLYDAEIVWNSKKNTTSDTVLSFDSPVNVTFTHSGLEGSLSLPCRFSEISKDFKIIDPVITDPKEQDPDNDGILDLRPLNYCIASDTYGLFNYYVTNDSSGCVLPYLDGICNRVVTDYQFKNCTSLKINGTELLTNIETIIDSFGEPSKSEYSSLFSKYTYNTTNGYIMLRYQDERDLNRPKDIEIRQNK